MGEDREVGRRNVGEGAQWKDEGGKTIEADDENRLRVI